MIKRANDLLAGLPMTIVGGVFLLLSFILPRVGAPWGEYLAWVCVVICGTPLLYLSVWRIIHNRGISKISSALLITVAMIAAIIIGDLFAAGEVAFIMEIGALLEDATTNRAKKGLRDLASLSPETGCVIREGAEVTVPVGEIAVGDTVRIRPGETVPADGVIISGETSLDQSVMTGESLPADKGPGDRVFGGTICMFGSVDIEVTGVGGDSSLGRLIRMVSDAEKDQAPTQRIADRWASILVPVALLIAVAAYIITGDIVRAVTVLVVFCPCALVLATPTAVIAAIGQATKHGVVIKSGQALERMAGVDTVALDKTGTLTCGRLEVSDVIPMGSFKAEELLSVAAACEGRSEHPIGRSIAEYTSGHAEQIPESSGFEMCAGRGVSAVVGGSRFYIGNVRYLKENGIDISRSREAADVLRAEGKAVVIAASEGDVVGVIALSDTARAEAADAVRRLGDMGAEVLLLTGDSENAARHLSSRVGISRVYADLMPEEKAERIKELKKTHTVCMVGDGVNDALSLKTADVGVAMGAMGSDITVDAADIALMTDDISKLPYLKWLANTAVKTIRGAITLSMCINFAAIILSVTGVLTPTTGALVHNAGSCFVVLLAALLYDRKYRPV